jgi:predicted GH43/DUF377 family glycosyl hydrolase
MIDVKKEGIVLWKSNLEFENEGVLNPAVIREGDNVHLFYRAVQQGNFSSTGYCRLDGPLTVAERKKEKILLFFTLRKYNYEKRMLQGLK